jgi:hypothetical protein
VMAAEAAEAERSRSREPWDAGAIGPHYYSEPKSPDNSYSACVRGQEQPKSGALRQTPPRFDS